MSEAGHSKAWKTAITRIEPNRVCVRGFDIAELMGRTSFGGAVYVLLRGEEASAAVSRLMDAMLVASMDHGVSPPSTLGSRNAASTGATLSGCVASGILAINAHHGGAIEACARQLGKIVERAKHHGESIEEAAAAVVREVKAAGSRMSGFGHRIHTRDPRTGAMLGMAREAGAWGEHVRAAEAVSGVLGEGLPINVDGAMGAILADLGFPLEAMNGMFMIGRTAGLVAHALEEKARERPMRRIDVERCEYDGPG